MLKRLGFALLLFALAGCGSDNTSTINTVSVPPSQSAPLTTVEANRQIVLDRYYTPALIAQMAGDAAALSGVFPGSRPFSTAQYGTDFIVGKASILDVFDARIPSNLQLFHDYAAAHGLVLQEPPNLAYWTYSQAGQVFLKDYGYDAVIYRPDEYHPVYTQTTDTWMFIREDVAGPPALENQGVPHYYSARVNGRALQFHGGVPMQPLVSDTLWPFYIPSPGSHYESYTNVSGTPFQGAEDPSKLNPYVPQPGTPEQKARRQADGHIPSPVSGRSNLTVGSWAPVSEQAELVREGFGFDLYTGTNDRYTFGTSGIYVLALDPDFWKN